jgi:hypothetical protein
MAHPPFPLNGDVGSAQGGRFRIMQADEGITRQVVQFM